MSFRNRKKTIILGTVAAGVLLGAGSASATAASATADPGQTELRVVVDEQGNQVHDGDCPGKSSSPTPGEQ